MKKRNFIFLNLILAISFFINIAIARNRHKIFNYIPKDKPALFNDIKIFHYIPKDELTLFNDIEKKADATLNLKYELSKNQVLSDFPISLANLNSILVAKLILRFKDTYSDSNFKNLEDIQYVGSNIKINKKVSSKIIKQFERLPYPHIVSHIINIVKYDIYYQDKKILQIVSDGKIEIYGKKGYFITTENIPKTVLVGRTPYTYLKIDIFKLNLDIPFNYLIYPTLKVSYKNNL